MLYISVFDAINRETVKINWKLKIENLKFEIYNLYFEKGRCLCSIFPFLMQNKKPRLMQ